MYSAREISNYIIKYSNGQEYSITNMRLQKLLYFIQLYSIYSYDKTCFQEDIEIWDLGPVVPIIYRIFNRYGTSELQTNYEIYRAGVKDIDNDEKITEIIRKVVDSLSKYSDYQLMKFAYEQYPCIKNNNPDKRTTIALGDLKAFVKGDIKTNKEREGISYRKFLEFTESDFEHPFCRKKKKL